MQATVKYQEKQLNPYHGEKEMRKLLAQGEKKGAKKIFCLQKFIKHDNF